MSLFSIARAAALLLTSTAWIVSSDTTLAESNDSAQAPAYTPVVVRPQTDLEYDVAKWQSQARVVSVSSGAIAFSLRLIDSDAKTFYRFAGNDLHPTVVVELPSQEPVDRVSAIFQKDENTKLDVYLLANLPEHFDRMSDAPIACTVDPAHPDEAGAVISTMNARYAVFRWTRSKSTQKPFSVAEVSVFGRVRPDQLPLPLADVHFSNETKVDFSNKLGALADPPSVNPISP